jgi:hypothetical protein
MLQVEPSAFHFACTSKREAVWRFVRPVFFLWRAFPCLRTLAIPHFVVANASYEATYGHSVTANLRVLRCACCWRNGPYCLPPTICGVEQRPSPQGLGEARTRRVVVDVEPDGRVVWGRMPTTSAVDLRWLPSTRLRPVVCDLAAATRVPEPAKRSSSPFSCGSLQEVPRRLRPAPGATVHQRYPHGCWHQPAGTSATLLMDTMLTVACAMAHAQIVIATVRRRTREASN